MIKHKSSKLVAGFTIVELLVSSGIIVLILGVVMAGYPKFKTRSSLSAVARETALFVREAQVYGLAVKEFHQGDDVFPPYGVHISKDKPKEIILFGDLDEGRSGVYDSHDGCGGEKTECRKRFNFAGPEYIAKMCVNQGGGTAMGDEDSEENCDIPELNISFHRPEPEAVIIVDDIGYRYNSARLFIKSSKDTGSTRIVRVWITGQISVE